MLHTRGMNASGALSAICGRCHRHNTLHVDVGPAQRALAAAFFAAPTAITAQLDQTRTGKTLGCMIATDGDQQAVTRFAFSGDLLGRPDVAGFVPSLLRRERTRALEDATLAELADITQELTTTQLAPAVVAALRARRRVLSQALMAAMHHEATAHNRAGHCARLTSFFWREREDIGIPSGTLDCALPKLLHAANVAGLTVQSVCEMTYRPHHPQHGQVETMCRLRCQPTVGFLLCDCSDNNDT